MLEAVWIGCKNWNGLKMKNRMSESARLRRICLWKMIFLRLNSL